MNRSHLLLFISILSVTFYSCSRKSVPSVEPGVTLELAEFRKSLISDLHYKLFFNIPKNPQKRIEATASVRFTLEDASYDQQLDFKESSEYLQSLSINGSAVEARIDREHIILPAEHLTTGENIVDIEFTAGDTSLNRNPGYLYTLFVPDRARTAFPLFDQPDLKAVFELSLEIPETWEAISNARLDTTTEKDSTKLLRFEPSDRFSSYLFSFVAGDFESITRTVDGVEMTMLHRETDIEKVERNLDEIFTLHTSSLAWLEEYTGIDYPFQKFDFALIPSFQYGGMEHVGAIQYRAGSLLLDEDPSDSQLLSRASLIAHETAHMWFGDLVTMKWFNDVWTKEVFANFMAAKIVNPGFPEINHDLNFMLRHHPSAYSVDRTEGANPIRQQLNNLNEAGQMYGAIIYNKAPIMMRQLEMLVGEELFRRGMRQYLADNKYRNATWPELIVILDSLTEDDLTAWSEVWVNTAGRPHFSLEMNPDAENRTLIRQEDPTNENRIWTQQFSILELTEPDVTMHSVTVQGRSTPLEDNGANKFIFNNNGYGYGLFPASLENLSAWNNLDDRSGGAVLINLFEVLLEGNIDPAGYYRELLKIIQTEENQLLIDTALSQLRTIYWNLFTEAERSDLGPDFESVVWNQMLRQDEPSLKKTFFNTFRNIALTDEQIQKVYDIWSGELDIEGLNLSETDFISMAGDLAIKRPQDADNLISTQLENIENRDRKRRFEFILPALSDDRNERDAFFESLKKEENRQTESWVLSALRYLHHPLRTGESEQYLSDSLELLEEIQVTGDIFFPQRWLDATLSNHSSDRAVQTVRDFLADNPDYNSQLRMKILQSADMLFRANSIRKR